MLRVGTFISEEISGAPQLEDYVRKQDKKCLYLDIALMKTRYQKEHVGIICKQITRQFNIRLGLEV